MKKTGLRSIPCWQSAVFEAGKMPNPQNQNNSCGEAGKMPNPQNQNNSCGEAGKMPNPQNQNNSCGVGVPPALQIVSKGILPEV